MKRLFTIAAIACMAVAPVFSAVTLTEEEWKSYCNISPNPELTTLTEIGPTFKVAARSTKNYLSRGTSTVEATLDLPNGEAREGLVTQEDMDVFTGRVSINFGESFDMAGKYVLTIPEGTIKLKDNYDEVVGVNPELTYVYNIIGAQEPLFNPLEKFELTPASGSTVGQIYKNLGIVFPDVTEDVEFHRAWVTGVTLTGPDGEQWNNYQFIIPSATVEKNNIGTPTTDEDDDDGDICVTPPATEGDPSVNATNFYFFSPIEEPGEYTLKIEKGTFRCVVPDPSSPTGVSDVYNSEIIAKYTIGEIGDDEVTLAKVVTEPSNEETINNFNQITLIFPNSNAPEQGIEKGKTSWTEIYLRCENDSRRYDCKNSKIADDFGSVTLSFHNVTTDGEYTLIVPEGVWKLRDCFPSEYNSPMEIPFHLNFLSNSVEGIDTEAEYAPVYDLNGTLILDNSTVDDLRSLPAGLYIRAGQRILLP